MYKASRDVMYEKNIKKHCGSQRAYRSCNEWSAVDHKRKRRRRPPARDPCASKKVKSILREGTSVSCDSPQGQDTDLSIAIKIIILEVANHGVLTIL